MQISFLLRLSWLCNTTRNNIIQQTQEETTLSEDFSKQTKFKKKMVESAKQQMCIAVLWNNPAEGLFLVLFEI